jgi:hypothetical protein
MKDCPEITPIKHKFLEPGNTNMEFDADHGKIEKKQKKTTDPILIHTIGGRLYVLAALLS